MGKAAGAQQHVLSHFMLAACNGQRFGEDGDGGRRVRYSFSPAFTQSCCYRKSISPLLPKPLPAHPALRTVARVFVHVFNEQANAAAAALQHDSVCRLSREDGSGVWVTLGTHGLGRGGGGNGVVDKAAKAVHQCNAFPPVRFSIRF